MVSARGILAALVGVLVFSSCDETREPSVAGGSSTETSNRLAARYVDEQGSPMRGASVHIRPADWGGGAPIDSILPDGRTRLDTLLDSAGRLNADGFRRGRYSVEVVSGSLSLRGELQTGSEEMVDTLLRPGGVSGTFSPAWKGVVRVVGSDVLVPTDDSGRFLREGLGVGVVVLDLLADSSGVTRKSRVRTVIPPRAVANLGTIALLTLQEEDPSLWNRKTRWIIDNTSTGITRDVSDFPLWIPLPDSILDRPDLSDLRVRDEGDSARAIELVPPLGGRSGGLWAWMKRIDGSSKEHHLDVLWRYDEAPSWSDPYSVFDSSAGWRGVWHFDRDDACAVRGCSVLSGNAPYDSGLSGMSRKFDGTQVLEASDSGTLEPPDLAVSVWVNLTSIVGTESRLVWKDSQGASSLPSWGFILRKSDGGLEVGFRMRGEPSDSGVFATMPTGRWVHLAATADRARGKAELFVDGASAGTFAIDASAPTPSQGKLIVGAGVVGLVDELRVSRMARASSWFALERVVFLQSNLLLHP